MLVTAPMNLGSDRWPHFAAAIVAATVGTLAWLRFFDWGNAELDTFDWSKELAYLSVIQEALQSLQLPVHTDRAFQNTHRFLANPEIPLSPQLVLLRWLDLRTYAIVNWCMLHVVGVAGTLALALRMRVSVVTTAFLFLLLGWNGYVVAHLAVGHSMWSGYFFYPWFAWALFGILEAAPQTRGRWAFRLGVILTLAMAQGGFHLTSWLLGFMALTALARPRIARAVGRAFVWFAALSAFRWLPAVVAFAQLRRPANPGFPGVDVLFAALAEVRGHDAPLIQHIGWWEYDAYIGPIALVLVMTLAMSTYIRGSISDRLLFVPVAVIFVLSMGDLWRPIADLPVPLVNSERGPSRFLIVPLFFMIIAAARADGEFVRRCPHLRALLAGASMLLLVLVARDLYMHLDFWSFPHHGTHHWPRINVRIVSESDPLYVASLVIGWSVSGITWILPVLRTPGDRRRSR